MIETSLNVLVECDQCDTQAETEVAIGHARRPDIDMFESRALDEFSEDGWRLVEGIPHLCPDCAAEEAA